MKRLKRVLSDEEEDGELAEAPARKSPAIKKRRRKNPWDDDEEDDDDADESEEEEEEEEEEQEEEEGELGETQLPDDGDADELDYDSADDYDEEFYKGDEDKARLLAMKQLDREMILMERSERAQRRIESLEVRNKIRQQREQQRRASARKRGSQMTQLDKNEKLRQLGKLRQDSAKRKESRLAEASRSKGSDEEGDDDGPRRSGWGGEDGADVESRMSAAPQHQEAPADSKQLERIRLTRNKLEQWLWEPFFDKVLPGCFVRVGIGKGPGGMAVYRAAEIVGTVDNCRLYLLGSRPTKKRLELKASGPAARAAHARARRLRPSARLPPDDHVPATGGQHDEDVRDVVRVEQQLRDVGAREVRADHEEGVQGEGAEDEERDR